jgi:phosphoribosylformylglycinamidine (FGAM) synthase-like amidotransferase family enzyme
MTAAIVTFPGSNRERDMVMALTRAFGTEFSTQVANDSAAFVSR